MLKGKLKGYVMYKFDFPYFLYSKYITECPFTDEELIVLNLRRKGYSIVSIAMNINSSTATVSRRIKAIEDKIERDDNLIKM